MRISLAVVFCARIIIFGYQFQLTVLILGVIVDKVFGPATTTRRVYDVAAQSVICGSMEGINGIL